MDHEKLRKEAREAIMKTGMKFKEAGFLNDSIRLLIIADMFSDTNLERFACKYNEGLCKLEAGDFMGAAATIKCALTIVTDGFPFDYFFEAYEEYKTAHEKAETERKNAAKAAVSHLDISLS